MVGVNAPAPEGRSASPAGPAAVETARRWARAQARRTASSLATAYGAHADVVSVSTDDDRTVMVMRVRDLHTWYVHRSLLGIRPETVLCEGDVCAGTAIVVTTPVRLVGRGVPGLLTAAAARARQPYRLWDQVYDLDVPLEDGDGSLWRYRGSRTPDGVPLLSPQAGGEPCPLPTVVRATGVLVPPGR